VEKAPDAFRTISEVAVDLDLPQHVLRFWETRFSQIKPMKRGGGRRYYRPDDVDLLRGIRHLLYGEGYTIRGVQRILKDEGVKFVQAVWTTGAPQPQPRSESQPHGANIGEADETDEGGRDPMRGLLGLWPSLLGGSHAPYDSESVERIEPALHSAAEEELVPHAPPEPPPNRTGQPAVHAAVGSPRQEDVTPGPTAASGHELHRGAILKLQATLDELSECRRLIDAALADGGV